jgi:hypothetical protein
MCARQITDVVHCTECFCIKCPTSVTDFFGL